MSKASEKALSDLHAKLAEVLREQMMLVDDQGKANAAILNVARQFLKDNGIDATPKQGTPLGNLANLPVFGDDEGVAPRLN